MTRRGMLRRILGICGLLAGRLAFGRDRPGAHREPFPSLPSELRRLQQHSAAVIGRAYLRQRPHEADTELLLRALALPGDATRQPIDGPTLQRRIRDDFSRGRVVAVERWVLSVTEARLCALHYLIG